MYKEIFLQSTGKLLESSNGRRHSANAIRAARNAKFNRLGMGCTTSVILFKGIRTVFERNCGYICKQQGENNALEYTAFSLPDEDSEILIHSFLVNKNLFH